MMFQTKTIKTRTGYRSWSRPRSGSWSMSWSGSWSGAWSRSGSWSWSRSGYRSKLGSRSRYWSKSYKKR